MDAPAGPGPRSAHEPTLTLSARERQAIKVTLLALPIVVVLAAIILAGSIINQFFSILAIFFLAWLVAFLLDPIVEWVVSRVSFLPRGVTASLVFIIVVILTVLLLAGLAGSFVASVNEVLGNAPTIDEAVTSLLAPLQAQLDDLGVPVDVTASAGSLIDSLVVITEQHIGELLNSGLVLFTQATAIVFIAVVMVASKARLLRFVQRLVPEERADFYADFVAATSRSFGGFIRGQFGIAALYGVLVGLIGLVFAIPFLPLVAVLTAALQSIPYFGQLVSWIPLLAATFVFRPDALVPVAIILAVTLLVVQNVISPRVLASAVGINPILVLAAVFVGAQLAGALGAVFGVPVAAVGATLFNAWLDRARPEPASTAATAASDQGQADAAPAGG